MRAWAILLPVALAAVNVAFPAVSAATMGWPWIERAAVAFAIAGLLGAFMGFALPFGMVRFNEASRAWYWAVNGAAGVVASVCSLGLAMTFGFERVVWMGVALYAIAAVALSAPTSRPR